jgi:hypothetical protein
MSRHIAVQRAIRFMFRAWDERRRVAADDGKSLAHFSGKVHDGTETASGSTPEAGFVDRDLSPVPVDGRKLV